MQLIYFHSAFNVFLGLYRFFFTDFERVHIVVENSIPFFYKLPCVRVVFLY
jgi:hypothetical protein